MSYSLRPTFCKRERSVFSFVALSFVSFIACLIVHSIKYDGTGSAAMYRCFTNGEISNEAIAWLIIFYCSITFVRRVEE